MIYCKDMVKALELILVTIKKGVHHTHNEDLDIWVYRNTQVYIDQNNEVIGIIQGRIHLPHVEKDDPNIHVQFSMHEIGPFRKGFGGVAGLIRK